MMDGIILKCQQTYHMHAIIVSPFLCYKFVVRKKSILLVFHLNESAQQFNARYQNLMITIRQDSM